MKPWRSASGSGGPLIISICLAFDTVFGADPPGTTHQVSFSRCHAGLPGATLARARRKDPPEVFQREASSTRGFPQHGAFLSMQFSSAQSLVGVQPSRHAVSSSSFSGSYSSAACDTWLVIYGSPVETAETQVLETVPRFRQARTRNISSWSTCFLQATALFRRLLSLIDCFLIHSTRKS